MKKLLILCSLSSVLLVGCSGGESTATTDTKAAAPPATSTGTKKATGKGLSADSMTPGDSPSPMGSKAGGG